MEESRIKDAFMKVKQDISELKEQIAQFSNEIVQLKEYLSQQTDRPALQHINSSTPAHNPQTPALQHINSSTPAHNLPLYALKSPNINISTGNEGVPADRQTDQQTNRHINNSSLNSLPEVLGTLNAIKDEVRIKFKNLTNQEISVLSMIYSLEEQSSLVDYSILSQKLSLTESSIRDYIQKLIKKGLPLIKTKENNKKVFISISPEFKQLVSLSTLSVLKRDKTLYSV